MTRVTSICASVMRKDARTRGTLGRVCQALRCPAGRTEWATGVKSVRASGIRNGASAGATLTKFVQL
jgi:hypothetical protein